MKDDDKFEIHHYFFIAWGACSGFIALLLIFFNPAFAFGMILSVGGGALIALTLMGISFLAAFSVTVRNGGSK